MEYQNFNACVDPKSQQGSGQAAIQFAGQPIIGICPFFWEFGLGSRLATPPPGNCLNVNARKNKFHVDRLGRAGPKISEWGMFILLEEIIHLYLWHEEQKRGVTEALEVYDANDVLKLISQKTVMNAASYVFYVASKSPTLVPKSDKSANVASGIYGNCTDFPRPPRTG